MSMFRHASRAMRWYVALDFMLGPLVVGALLFATFLLFVGLHLSFYDGVPFGAALGAVAVAWWALAVGVELIGARIVRWARA